MLRPRFLLFQTTKQGFDGLKKEIKRAKRAFDLALGIEDIFKKGTPEEKNHLLRESESNLTIKGKKLNVYNTGVYKRIIDSLLLAKSINPSFEPKNCEADKGRNPVFASVCPTLLGLYASARSHFSRNPG